MTFGSWATAIQNRSIVSTISDWPSGGGHFPTEREFVGRKLFHSATVHYKQYNVR